MKHYIIITFALLTLSISCKSIQSKETTNTSFQSVFEIPDSLLTLEQDSLKRGLVDVLINHLDYKDNRVTFRMTKKEFTNKGYDPEYYDIIVNNLNLDNKLRNSYIDDIDWEKLINDKIKEYKNDNIKKGNTP